MRACCSAGIAWLTRFNEAAGADPADAAHLKLGVGSATVLQ